MALESSFQSRLIKELESMFPGAVVLKNDPNYLQGFPDLLILHGNRWAALETKRDSNSRRRPNQPYYVDKLDKMSYAAFIYPGNKEQILSELQHALGLSRAPCVSQP